MKKIISFILVAMLCIGVLTGCEQVGGALDSVTGAVGGAWDTVVGTVGGWLGIEQPAKGPSIEDASSYLNEIYKDKNQTTTGDFDVVGKIILEGVSFDVTWTSDNAAITIRESTKVGFYTVDLPDKNDVEFNYTLTATVTNEAGESAQRSFSFKVPVINNSGITSTPVEGVAYKLFLLQGTYGQRFYALNTTQDNGNKFINTTVDPKAGVDFYVEAVDGGYKIYTDIKGVKTYVYAKVEVSVNEETGAKKYSKFIGFNAEEGSVFSYSEAKGGVWTVNVDGLVYGVGTYGDYTTISLSDESYFTPEKVGDSQFVMQFITSEYANTLAPDEIEKVEVPAPNSTLTVKEAIDLGLAVIGYTEGKYYVTGEITNIYQTTYGNMYIKDAEGNELCIYGTYDATGKNRFDAMENQPKVGDTVTIYGVVGNYNGTAQIKNGWITAINGENLGGGETPSAPTVVDAPVVGTAYKFGLFHGGQNAEVFFNGKNYESKGTTYAWYLAFGSASEAVDVYLEAVEGVEGGYRLYFMNGEAKTYIRTYPRDGDTTKGTLEMTTTVPTECYTYDAEHKTLIYTSTTGEQFYLGSSGTYKSISVSAISYIDKEDSYISHFYLGGSGSTETPDNPDNPGTKPDAPVTGNVQLTVDSMGLPSQSYNAESSTATVNGVEFEFIQLGNYGDGIQMRDKDGKTSMLWNTTAFATPIVRIELVFSSTKSTHDNADAVIFTFGNEVKGATYTTKLSTAAGTATYTITPDAETYTYFYLEHDLSYSFYWESITIVLAEEDTHEHSYNSVVTAPTCTAAGYTTYTCECGDSYTADETAATGHTEVVDAAVEAKCEATGLTEGKHCSVCNEVLVAQQETKALGHDMIVDEAKAPTCTETGLTAGEHCDRCDYKVAQETVPANGHTDAEPKDFICDVCKVDLCTNHTEETIDAVAPTCTATGLTEGKQCSICGEILVAQEVVKALGHDETSSVTAPTCTKPGYTTYTCSVCGASRTADETEATGIHTETPVVTAPTCTAAGYTTYTCSVCGASRTADETEATGHADENGDFKCDTCSTAMLPEDGATITISQALAIAQLQAHNTYTTQKYYITGIVTGLYNTQYGNFYIKDADGNEICIYGLYSADGKTRYDAMEYKPVDGDEVTVYTVLGMFNSTKQGKDAWLDDVVAHEHTYADGKCSICGAVDPSVSHVDENGDFICDDCSAPVLPEDGTTLTVSQALAVGKLAGDAYSTQKYYITGIVTGLYNTQYGNFYIQDADGNKICIYGLYSKDGKTRYDAMEYKPVDGDEVTVYTVLGTYNSTPQGKSAWLYNVAVHEHDYKSVVTEPTCTASGYTTYTCSCGDSYTDNKVDALGHTAESGTCDRCGKEIGGEAVVETLATFDFGANGSAAHVDGNDFGASKSYTAGSYTLNLTGMSKVFGPAYDAKGNSCIKLGTSKVTGTFSFTVGDNVTEVVIYVAGYKAATSTNININGTQYNVKTTSNSGEYTAITIDTTTNKTITFTSVTYRCMIDSIVFNGYAQ